MMNRDANYCNAMTPVKRQLNFRTIFLWITAVAARSRPCQPSRCRSPALLQQPVRLLQVLEKLDTLKRRSVEGIDPAQLLDLLVRERARGLTTQEQEELGRRLELLDGTGGGVEAFSGHHRPVVR
jgi:hypothetical protein